MKTTYAIGLVYRDGNPSTIKSGLTAEQALKAYGNMRETNVAARNIIVWDADDPERGYFGPDRLLEVIEEERFADEVPTAHDPQEWPEYAQAVEAEETGPDLNNDDLHG